MIQQKNHKRNSETIFGFSNQTIFHKRVSRTPELKRSNTPQKTFKKKRTPLKVQEKEKEKVEPTIKKQTEHNPSSYRYQEPTLCETAEIKPSTFKCKTCEQIEFSCKACKQKEFLIKQLETEIKQHKSRQIQFSGKLKELKDEYEKRLKKYKAKSRIQKDQLNLLKWILSERKEFHQILQQLEKMKESKNLQVNNNEDKLSMLQQNPISENSRTKQVKTKDISAKQTAKQIPQQKSQLQMVTVMKNNQSQNIPNPRQLQMQDQINVLEQKVMELTIRNDFLEKIKIKVDPYPFCQNNSISFKQQSQSNAGRSYYEESLKEYQYSDEQESFERQRQSLSEKPSYWMVPSKPKVCEVQSRYVSPLRQRLNDSNMRESERKGIKFEQKQNNLIPESRSKYVDSIRERSRLLGI